MIAPTKNQQSGLDVCLSVYLRFRKEGLLTLSIAQLQLRMMLISILRGSFFK